MEHELLLEKVGETYSNKLISQCQKIYLESFTKKFPDYFEKNHSKMSSLVTVTNPDSKEITGIGMSCIDDLLLNNWGLIFGAILSGQGGFFSMQNELGLSRNITVWGLAGAGSFAKTNFGAVGSRISVGTGVTPASRSNFKMETIIQNLNSGNGGWISGLGKVTIPAQVSAVSSFSISETGLFGVWADGNGQISTVMISHDNISPVVSVIIAQTINVDYQLLLS